MKANAKNLLKAVFASCLAIPFTILMISFFTLLISLVAGNPVKLDSYFLGYVIFALVATIVASFIILFWGIPFHFILSKNNLRKLRYYLLVAIVTSF